MQQKDNLIEAGKIMSTFFFFGQNCANGVFVYIWNITSKCRMEITAFILIQYPGPDTTTGRSYSYELSGH